MNENAISDTQSQFNLSTKVMSDIVHHIKYARFLPEKQRKESFEETVQRNKDMHLKKFSHVDGMREQIDWAYDFVFDKKVLPSMRSLQYSGRPIELNETRGFNCAYVPIDTVEVFCEMMFLLLGGSGVGYSVQRHHIDKLPPLRMPKINPQTGHYKSRRFLINDSIEGWADAIKALIKAYFYGHSNPVFDFSAIRPKGALLKTAGGRAPGPQPLKDCIHNLRKILDTKKPGDKLRPIDAHHMICFIADAVVSGGSRRCLGENSLIHTERGLVPIRDVEIGEKVKTLSGFKPVLAKECTGTKEMLTIRTQIGEYRSTPDHRWAVLSDLHGGIRWVEAKDLCETDCLYFSTDPLVTEQNAQLPEFSFEKREADNTSIDILSPELDDDIAWLIGYFHGDGYAQVTGRKKKVEFAVGPRQMNVAEKIYCLIKEKFGYDARIKQTRFDNCIRVTIDSVQLNAWFRRFKSPKQLLIVPDFIMKGTVENRLAYVAGLFDADGSCILSRPGRAEIRINSIFKEYLEQISSLLKSCGIPSCINLQRPAQGNWKDLYVLKLIGRDFKNKFAELVQSWSFKIQDDYHSQNTTRDIYSFKVPNFLLKEDKNRKMFAWIYANDNKAKLTWKRYQETTGDYKNFVPIEILSIQPSEPEITYDISVESEEMFFYDGLLVHNSALLNIFSFDDEEMKYCKTGRFWEENAHLGRANNSAMVLRHRVKEEEFRTYWKAIEQNGTGEPGIIFSNNSEMGANPCVTADTVVLTEDGPREVSELIEKPFKAVVNGKTYPSFTGFWYTGEKEVFEIELENGLKLKLTDNHKILILNPKTNEETFKELKDVRDSDFIALSRFGHRWSGDGDFNQGWLLGNCLGDGYFSVPRRMAKLEYWGSCREEMLSLAIERLNSLWESCHRKGYRKEEKVGVGSVDLFNFATKFLKEVGKEKELNESALLKTSSDFFRGFIRGMFDADGSPQGNALKGHSVRLVAIRLNHLELVQKMLLYLGINSKIYKFRKKKGTSILPDGKGGSKEYNTQAVHELIISKDNIVKFWYQVGFDDPLKKERLNSIVESTEIYQDKFCCKIRSKRSIGIQSVYDCTVEEIHRFSANGIIVHNCVEASLYPTQFCNLTVINGDSVSSQEDFNDRCKAASIIGTLQAAYTDFHYLRECWQDATEKDALLGVSITGIASGKLDSLSLREGAMIVNQTNEDIAKLLGINKAARTTLVKPDGTTSLIFGCSSGIHDWFARFYIRRVTIMKNDPIYDYLLNKLPELIEDNREKPHLEAFIKIPMRSPETGFVDSGSQTLLERVLWVTNEWIKPAHRKGDNMHNVSTTVAIEPNEWDFVGDWVWKHRNDFTGMAFYPKDTTVYLQAPHEEITEEQYLGMLQFLKEIDLTEVHEFEDNTSFSAQPACAGGACEWNV